MIAKDLHFSQYNLSHTNEFGTYCIYDLLINERYHEM